MGEVAQALQPAVAKFECVKQPLAFPTISAKDVYNFLGDHQVWFNYGNGDGPEPLGFVGAFAIFQERVKRLYTNQGAVFLQLKPLHRDNTPLDKIMYHGHGQVHGKPYVWDVMDSLQIYERPDDFHVFHMYYGNKESCEVWRADCVEIDTFIPEADFDMHFRDQLKTQDLDDVMRAYRAVVAARQSSAAPDMC